MARNRVRSSHAGRDARLDMLRGVALLCMFVAALAPSAWLPQAMPYVHYLALPLFVLIMGMSAQRSAEERPNLVTAFVRAGIRAIALAALGLWLTSWGANVDVVLIYLALPTVLAAILARCSSLLLWVGIGVGWLATQATRVTFAPDRAKAAGRHDELGVWLWDAVATGVHYRGVEILAYVCAGILLARNVTHARGQRASLAVGGVVLLAAAVALRTLAEAGTVHAAAYSGSRAAVALSLCLTVGVAALWFAAVPAKGRVPALEAIGGMTLSAYVLLIAFLAWFVSENQADTPANVGVNFAILSGLAFGLCWAWRTSINHDVLRRGPIEGPLALVTGIFR